MKLSITLFTACCFLQLVSGANMDRALKADVLEESNVDSTMDQALKADALEESNVDSTMWDKAYENDLAQQNVLDEIEADPLLFLNTIVKKVIKDRGLRSFLWMNLLKTLAEVAEGSDIPDQVMRYGWGQPSTWGNSRRGGDSMMQMW